jgi:hypothetical protein
MVRDHHERLDGSGYPSALSGDEIALGARIIAVADTFDAITSVRPYRSARTHKQAIEILKQEAGTKLDPVVVRAFCSHYAGRHPLALWSAVAGLPERLLSWLGGSLAGVASVAKMVVVAALVGGAAVTSSTLGFSAHGPKRAKAHSASVDAHSSVRSTPAVLSSQGRSATLGAHRVERLGPHVRRRSVHGRTPATEPTASRSETTTAQPGGSGEGAGPGKGRPEEPPAKGRPEEPPAKGRPEEPPAKGRPEEPPAKGRPEEPPAKGRPEEPPAKGRPEEPPAKGRPEEPPAKGRPEEPPAKGRSEEPPVKGGAEEPPVKGKP